MDARHPIPDELSTLTDAVCGSAFRLNTALKGGATLATLEQSKASVKRMRTWLASLEKQLGEHIRSVKSEERDVANVRAAEARAA